MTNRMISNTLLFQLVLIYQTRQTKVTNLVHEFADVFFEKAVEL